VVCALEDVPGDVRLVAYLVARPQAAIDVASCGSCCASGFRSIWCRRRLWFLEAIPLNPSARSIAKRLPKPERERDRATEYLAPRNATEQTAGGGLRRVLKLETHRHSGRFLRGGRDTPLLATQVIGAHPRRAGISLPVRQLFERRTVQACRGRCLELLKTTGPRMKRLVRPFPASRARAGRVARKDSERRVVRSKAIMTGDHFSFRLSFAQQRLWFLEQLEPGCLPTTSRARCACWVHSTWTLCTKRLQVVVDRHEALRTTFRKGAEGPEQILAAECAFDLPVVDLSGLSPQEREKEVLHLASIEAAKPFDLVHGPLFRATLYRTGPEQHVLMLSIAPYRDRRLVNRHLLQRAGAGV